MNGFPNDRTSQTLINLRNEEKISSDQVVICLTIPLQKDRFLAEKNGVAWWGRLFGLSRDFAKNFSERYGEHYWEGENDTGYLQRVALPVLQSLLELKEHTQATIIPDCTFSHLRTILAEDRYRLLILLAHHYENKIEFANGGIEISKVKELFASAYRRLSLCLLVCESESTGMAIKDNQTIQSMAFSHFELSVVHAAEFTVSWLRVMDGNKTLSQTYNEALHHFLNLYS